VVWRFIYVVGIYVIDWLYAFSNALHDLILQKNFAMIILLKVLFYLK